MYLHVGFYCIRNVVIVNPPCAKCISIVLRMNTVIIIDNNFN